eukprot:1438662-Rhodomonas_salina.2
MSPVSAPSNVIPGRLKGGSEDTGGDCTLHEALMERHLLQAALAARSKAYARLIKGAARALHGHDWLLLVSA